MDIIWPGQEYEGLVALWPERKQYRLCVFKYHIFPACEFPPDPEDENELDQEDKIEVDWNDEEDFLKAA